MKAIIRNRWTIIVAVQALTLFAGCRKPTADVVFEINTAELYKAPALLHFVNANPDSPTDLPSSFNVEISGKDAKLVVTNTGTKSFKVVEGFLPLALLPQATVSEAKPVVFNVFAEIPGYAPITQSFIITTDDPTPHEIAVTEYAHPPKGTSVLIKSSTIANGVAGNITLNIATNPDMSEASSIKITDRTEMKDVDGNVIQGNTLTSRIIHYGTQHPDALNAFPGGFIPIIEGEDFSSSYFVTAGLLSIRMNVGNKQVKSFSKPLTVTMEVSDHLQNPVTNTEVQAGDTIPVWSMDEKTGIWKKESTAVFLRNTAGKLQVQFPVQHLTPWNVDIVVPRCPNPFSVKIKIPSPPKYTLPCTITMSTANGQVLGRTFRTVFDGWSQIFGLASNIPVRFALSTKAEGKLAETSLMNVCGGGSVDITINTVPLIQWLDIDLKVQGKCTGRNATAKISGWFCIRKTTQKFYRYIYVRNGEAKFKVQNGFDYVGETYYDGVLYKGTGRFAAMSTAITSQNGFEGQTIYDPVSKTLNANFSFNVNCK